MKGVVTILLLALVGTDRLGAQAAHSAVVPVFIDSTVQQDGGRILFARRPLRPVRPLFGVATGSEDSARARHHYVRNGAILGGSIGFVVGAIGGGILSDRCVNCSRGMIAVAYVGGIGGASALLGAILGGVTGQVVEWTRH